MSENGDDEGFETRLGRVLLVAFAAGESVEGNWQLTFDDDFVPDVRVSVLRVDPEGDAPSTETTFEPAGYDDFETELRSFLLGEFADGTRIEGSWTVRYAREALPAWDVYVEVNDADAGLGDVPSDADLMQDVPR